MSRTVDRILHALQVSPGLTREEIAERAFVSINTLSGGGYLKEMKELGLIHISGWRRNASGAFVIPQYSAGADNDYPRPSASSPTNRHAPGMSKLFEVIEKFGPLDYRQAAIHSGLAVSTVKSAGYLEALMAQGKIYISGWRRNQNGPMRPLYEAGNEPNQPRPEPYTAAAKARSYRARQRRQCDPCSIAGQLGLVPRAGRSHTQGSDKRA